MKPAPKEEVRRAESWVNAVVAADLTMSCTGYGAGRAAEAPAAA